MTSLDAWNNTVGMELEWSALVQLEARRSRGLMLLEYAGGVPAQGNDHVSA